jgi:hypothetical protein
MTAVYRHPWTWLLPLAASAAVIVFVLSTTPPGFRAVSDVLFGSPRGPVGDAAAYTLGSAASLGLITLLLMTLLCGALALALKQFRPRTEKR